MKGLPENLRVDFVDDDPVANRLFERYAIELGFRCRVFDSAEAAIGVIGEQPPDIVLTDLNMPATDGFMLIERLARRHPLLPIVAVTGQSTIERAVKAMRTGAVDFLRKPYSLQELELTLRRNLSNAALRRENLNLKRQLAEPLPGYGMIGDSPAMWAVYRLIDKVADVDCPVIVQGDSGVGKELVARAIHDRGVRRNAPFVVVDCGAIADTLLESELFGHRKGAFTGADRDRVGLLESAAGGTVFLDEIGNISESMQTKLLRVIENATVLPVGDSRPRPVAARFIAATNAHLAERVRAGAFREDLYHRLNVVAIGMPRLVEREGDLPLLIEHFSQSFAARHGRPPRRFAPETIAALAQRPWPGNVRELRNFVERCVIMSDGPRLDIVGDDAAIAPALAQWFGALDTIDDLSQRYVRFVLDRTDGNLGEAARILGIGRTTLWRWLQRERSTGVSN